MKLSTVLCSLFLCCAAFAEPKIGDTIFKETDYRHFSLLKSTVKDGVLTITAGESAGAKGNQLLQRSVWGKESKAKVKTNYTRTRGVCEFLKPYLGYFVEISAEIKSDVPVSKVPWEGVRFSLNFDVDTEPYAYSYNGIAKETDWKKYSFFARIPYDLRDASITIGIIGTQGTVSFRNLKITIKDFPHSKYFTGKPISKYHKLESLRGTNAQWWTFLGPELDKLCKRWKFNLYCTGFTPSRKILKGEELDDYLKKHVYDCLDDADSHAARHGVYYVIGMSDPFHDPNHPTHSDLFYHVKGYPEYLVDIWTRIAKHYKGRKYIYGFQLINESCLRVPKQPGFPDYEEMMERIAKAINKVDPERTIIVQPEEWWSFRAFDRMRPINAKNVVYAPHFYSPFAFSHQGISNKTVVKYPGMIGNKMWNKETLRKVMRPARDFQLRYNVHMLVTEFSVNGLAPDEGRAQWVKDTIELFEEYNWDWSWHAINEFWGWRPDWVKSPKYQYSKWNLQQSWMPAKETGVSKVIDSYLAKNKFLPKANIPLKPKPVLQNAKGVKLQNIKIDYPVEKLAAGGYVYGKGQTFDPLKNCIRASWLKSGKPTDFLEYRIPLKNGEWTPHFIEYKVKGAAPANTLSVFRANKMGGKTTWLCLKDLKAFVNGKEVKASWPLMGFKIIDKNEKTLYIISGDCHIYASVNAKNGDIIRIEWAARAATQKDFK